MERNSPPRTRGASHGRPPVERTSQRPAATSTGGSRLLVSLDAQHSRVALCVAIVSLGEPTHESLALMAQYNEQATNWHCAFSATVLLDDSPETERLLKAQVPEGAIVVVLAGQSAQSVPLSDAVKARLGPAVHTPLPADSEQAQHALDPLQDRVIERLNQGLQELSASLQPAQTDLLQQQLALAMQRLHEDQRALARQSMADPFEPQGLFPYGSCVSSHLDCTPSLIGVSGTTMSVQYLQNNTAVEPAQASDVLQAFSLWHTLPDAVKNNSEVWSAIAASPDADHLVALVSKMHQQKPAPDGPVARLLTRLACAMAQDPAFAEQVLLLAFEGSQRCVDRQSLVLFRLETALMAHQLNQQAQQAGTAQQPHAVFRLARQVLRRAQLEAIAARKVSDLEQQNRDRRARGEPLLFIDEVETHLAYLCELRDILQLGGEPVDAQFVSEALAHVSSHDISLALDEVLTPPVDGFPAFLCDYAPWQAALRADARWGPEVAAMEAQLSDYDSLMRVQQEVEAAVALTQVTGREFQQAVTREVSRRSQENNQRAWRELTQRVLEQEQAGWAHS